MEGVEHPQAEQVELDDPDGGQSSLSHWSTVRPSIRPHSTGTTCHSGRSAITIPPEWIPRWRGNPSRR
jgi:hypothetical protein